ncbi:hypothetical protein [Caldiplasma sukawensis]
MKSVFKKDKSVSEIIGAILLFAIASVVLTSFILWYVPSTSTNNEIAYQKGTQSSFSSLDTKMQASGLNPGDSISQSVPIGINGVPPFSPSQSTGIYYSNNFNASLNYNFNVSYINPVKNKVISTYAAANASSSNIYTNLYVDKLFEYSVNFIESGLPSGYYWTIQLGGVQKSASSSGSTTQSVISYSLSRGTYAYSITTDNLTYKPNPSSGSVKVTDQELNIYISFINDNTNKTLVAGVSGNPSSISPENVNNEFDTSTIYLNSVSQCMDYWLNSGNITGLSFSPSTRFYRLASQEFYATPDQTINKITFYVEPSLQYLKFYYRGVSSIYLTLSNASQPFNNSAKYTIFSAHLTINPSGSTCYNSSINPYYKVTISLPSPVELSGNYGNQYYLNFWESVNESSYSNNNPGQCCPVIIYNQDENYGWGYGPNLFIGAVSSNDASITNTVSAYSYETNIEECYNIFSGNDTFIPVSSHIVSSDSCVYAVSLYDCPRTTTAYSHITIHENGLPTGSEWNSSVLLHSVSTNKTEANFTVPEGYIYNYSVKNDVYKGVEYVAIPSSGYINTKNNATINIYINFSIASGNLPSYWGISDKGEEFFKLTQAERANFLTLYLLNFTISPGAYSGGNISSYIKVSITGTNVSLSNIYRINTTGYTRLPIFGNGKLLPKGNYTLCVEDVNPNGTPAYGNGDIGWGFTTTGGYDNYFQTQQSDLLTQFYNISTSSYITNYGSTTPQVISASHQSFIFQIGKCYVPQGLNIFNTTISGHIYVKGSINSLGITQFTISEKYILQDGIVITAGKGVTYLTINPLPFRIIKNSDGNYSLGVIAYGMNIQNGVPTSVDGVGSTIISMELQNATLLNYTTGGSYIFNHTLGKVIGIDLNSFAFDINTTYGEYWGETLLEELGGSGNYTNFNLYNIFTWALNGNQAELKQTSSNVKLDSLNIKSLNFIINSL